MKSILLALALALFPRNASAVCDNTVEEDEQALWNVHNCWPVFRDWFPPHFKLKEHRWDDGWGWGTCDPTQAFGKMWNAAYLLTFGLNSTNLGPWHSDADYSRWASGEIHGFRYEPEEWDGAFAGAIWGGLFVRDRVEMYCPSFNDRTAGVRAGTILHEATHQITHWQHQANRRGSNCIGNCSDDWLFHNLDEYPYGSLAGNDHSMVQIQIEFLCDLAEFGQWWVPNQTGLIAQAEANNRMDNRIRNPPGWTCGTPRPVLNEPEPPEPPEPLVCRPGQVCCGSEVNGACMGFCAIECPEE